MTAQVVNTTARCDGDVRRGAQSNAAALPCRVMRE